MRVSLIHQTPNTKSGYDEHRRRYHKHPEGPERHFSLGYKVFLGALMLVAGPYFTNYAFRFSAVLGEGEALFYMFLGLAGIGVGVGYILAYGFAVLPP